MPGPLTLTAGQRIDVDGRELTVWDRAPKEMVRGYTSFHWVHDDSMRFYVLAKSASRMTPHPYRVFDATAMINRVTHRLSELTPGAEEIPLPDTGWTMGRNAATNGVETVRRIAGDQTHLLRKVLDAKEVTVL